MIGMTAERAEDALVALAGCVPRDVDLGRPLVAWAEDGDGCTQVLTSTGFGGTNAAAPRPGWSRSPTTARNSCAGNRAWRSSGVIDSID